MIIDWQKIYDYVDANDITQEQFDNLTLKNIILFFWPDTTAGTEDADNKVESIKNSYYQIRQVVKEAMIEKVKKEKFEIAKTFILNNLPDAVVERSGDEVIIKEYL